MDATEKELDQKIKSNFAIKKLIKIICFQVAVIVEEGKRVEVVVSFQERQEHQKVVVAYLEEEAYQVEVPFLEVEAFQEVVEASFQVAEVNFLEVVTFLVEASFLEEVLVVVHPLVGVASFLELQHRVLDQLIQLELIPLVVLSMLLFP